MNLRIRVFLIALLVALAALASSASTAEAAVNVTYSPFVTWSLNSADYFAGAGYFRGISSWPPPKGYCRPAYGRPQSVNTYVVPTIGTGVWKSPYGGYADLAHCRIYIGAGSWAKAHRVERKYWGKWLYKDDFCPLMVHEASHFYLWTGSHDHTPDLNNPYSRHFCKDTGRVNGRVIGWNRAYHNPGVRHG